MLIGYWSHPASVSSTTASLVRRARCCSAVARHLSSMDNLRPFPHFATEVLHTGQEPEKWESRAVVPPISLSTTFKQTAPGEHAGYEYSRSGNPTRDVLEKCLAAAEGGKHALTFASGLAGTTTLCHLLSAGDHIVCADDVYGGTNRYFQRVASRFNVDITFIDFTDPENLRSAIKPNTRMVWVETPTNPMLKLADIEAVSAIAHEHTNVLVVVDNTFMSAYFQRPLSLGADIAFHSLTKYMNGHSDVVMGAVILNDDAVAQKLRFLQNAIGAVPSPFDCYMANRGMKTLHLRMQEHMRLGLAVANYLDKDPRVTKVIHPGLPSHPQHELAKKQMRGFSGMITFFIKGGLEEARTFLKSLKVFSLAESLGGYESLAEHPALMTHASVPAEMRASLGISDSLIRLSVGLEDLDDLIADLHQALSAAVPDAN